MGPHFEGLFDQPFRIVVVRRRVAHRAWRVMSVPAFYQSTGPVAIGHRADGVDPVEIVPVHPRASRGCPTAFADHIVSIKPPREGIRDLRVQRLRRGLYLKRMAAEGGDG